MTTPIAHSRKWLAARAEIFRTIADLERQLADAREDLAAFERIEVLCLKYKTDEPMQFQEPQFYTSPLETEGSSPSEGGLATAPEL